MFIITARWWTEDKNVYLVHVWKVSRISFNRIRLQYCEINCSFVNHLLNSLLIKWMSLIQTCTGTPWHYRPEAAQKCLETYFFSNLPDTIILLCALIDPNICSPIDSMLGAHCTVFMHYYHHISNKCSSKSFLAVYLFLAWTVQIKHGKVICSVFLFNIIKEGLWKQTRAVHEPVTQVCCILLLGSRWLQNTFVSTSKSGRMYYWKVWLQNQRIARSRCCLFILKVPLLCYKG